jgi:cyclopropane fatty-acyl-phospholipid synthase-like methyltransferase
MTSEFDQYVKTYDKDLKDSMPAGLEETEYFARYKVDYLVRALGRKSVDRILDFGCGAGRSLHYLAGAFPTAELHGFDPSEESIRIAADQFPAATLCSNWDVVDAKGFDLILAANVFHHIRPAEIPQWLSRCGKALRSDGEFFIFEHNPLNPLTRYVFERCVFDQDAKMIRRPALESMAMASGLEVSHGRYTLFFPKPLQALRPLEQWLGWLPLGAQYCLRLTKKRSV